MQTIEAKSNDIIHMYVTESNFLNPKRWIHFSYHIFLFSYILILASRGFSWSFFLLFLVFVAMPKTSNDCYLRKIMCRKKDESEKSRFYIISHTFTKQWERKEHRERKTTNKQGSRARLFLHTRSNNSYAIFAKSK